jgi:hypothetical protein
MPCYPCCDISCKFVAMLVHNARQLPGGVEHPTGRPVSCKHKALIRSELTGVACKRGERGVVLHLYKHLTERGHQHVNFPQKTETLCCLFCMLSLPLLLRNYAVLGSATTRYLYVVYIYGAICLQILLLKHHIFLFCHEMLKFFA